MLFLRAESAKFLCSWCNYLITDFAEFYQHILYNEKHLSNIRAVFLEDISYHLQFLRRQLYSPLLQESESNVKTLSKAQIADNFQKLCRKLKVHSTDLPPSRNSFFLHFVKKCAICNVSLLGRPSVLEHLCNDTHYKKLLEARVTAKDFAFWNSMFS
ncbi:unnamed protein product [Caenorhabditis auriculariae]|uniref:Uncharacterized protein n=1 Tax=Caenorhabditis auriculariae TaxID=2777116 RepID=A0A8S1GVX6_9PELO|nr:unnamed protein product [Caenorhabditis auriculariae]